MTKIVFKVFSIALNICSFSLIDANPATGELDDEFIGSKST